MVLEDCKAYALYIPQFKSRNAIDTMVCFADYHKYFLGTKVCIIVTRNKSYPLKRIKIMRLERKKKRESCLTYTAVNLFVFLVQLNTYNILW